MLYSYPIDATADNWLHDCLYEMLRSIHNSLQNGQEPPEWPNIIPEAVRTKLHGRTGVRDRLRTYGQRLAMLPPHERNRVFRALEYQNRIQDLVSCTCNCESILDLPESIRDPVKDLFGFVFALLTDFGVRDTHYQKIYYSVQYPVCPFCGCEYFDAPGAPREDLDHYLAKNHYPFAAVNLRNLVPMGAKCNSRYKFTQDILKKVDGTRRRSFDPYNSVGVKISLDNSEPFAGVNGQLPAWQIEFDRDIEEVTTWDDVFQIRTRYERDILDRSFKSWLSDFSSWCRSFGVKLASHDEIKDAVGRYAEYLDTMGIRDFLKAAVFRMLYRHCAEGHERLVSFMKDLAIGTDRQAA